MRIGLVCVTMIRPSNRLFAALLAVATLATCAWSAEFPIHDGDRVVFLGDSITEQRLYTTYLESYILTRHPTWTLSFRNVGWGGDTAWLRQRAHPNEGQLFAADEGSQQKMVEDSVGRGLSRDVLPLRPTFVTVKFGMNDHAYQAFREDIFRAYSRSQTEIAKVLGATGARLAFLTPQPIEEGRPDPDQDIRNVSLRKFSDGLKSIASKEGAIFVDQFDPYMTLMMHERANNPAAKIGGGDAVHPGPAGHTLMAWAILKSLGASDLVSRAEIEVPTGKVAIATGCEIKNLKVAPKQVSFDRLDEALPMPIDPKAESALKLAPILKDLNGYELRISGLETGRYEIKVDGDTVAKIGADELAQSWNLATSAGAITRQAQQVLSLVVKKNNVYFQRWRQVQLFDCPPWAQGPEFDAKRTAELARLDQEIADLETQINLARKPKSHHFEVGFIGQ